MNFNEKRAKESAIDTGAAVAGAVAGLALTNKATAMLTEKSPSSGLIRHVPALVLGALIAAQAFDVIPDNPLVDSAIQGASVVAGMQVVREYTGANTAAGLTATSGLQHLINQYVPAFTAEGTTAVTTAVQAALPAASGVNGLGLLDYRDPAQAALMAGQYQQRELRTLGNPGWGETGSSLKDLG